ncbi:helix-turn-helix domain-containing protein [Rhodococcus sp. HM1]|uniref:IclR family transcriptional regulator domain-containing protein n=1 Tax=unclassified Rhodococcus (in: high G+C Gram-positive bacteria) TaxID=192944 RepID=UPI0018CF0F43|nr:MULTISPECIES: IclR family transcriptional regulator C-terminal domain-containing protein [unclassified Rhodococcus (in: high G+C Gram-positive bacteria)]MBH0122900.1 helix-turn-helix domain-containing protein [Rhodococcus sp. CX]MCK8671702.1 helix-turn-helix domain-containing protein [Rhodococcus sp. HM1]
MSENEATTTPPEQNRDHVQALGRGLEVLKLFGRERRPLSVTEVAGLAGITRTAARRFVLTLEYMGYLSYDGTAYAARPAILEIGDAYVLSSGLPDIVRPHLERLAAQTQETASLTVLHHDKIFYVDRVQANRVLTVEIVVGTSLPAYAVATGRVLLADRTDAELDAYLASVNTHSYTEATTIDTAELREKIIAARNEGWSLADQELSEGVRSIAVPVRDADGRAVAALNVSAQSSRVSLDHMRGSILTVLRNAAEQIREELAAI